jgi:hypothetical protein
MEEKQKKKKKNINLLKVSMKNDPRFKKMYNDPKFIPVGNI